MDLADTLDVEKRALCDFRTTLVSGSTPCTAISTMIRLAKMVKSIAECRLLLPVVFGAKPEILWGADIDTSVPFDLAELKNLPGSKLEFFILPDARSSAPVQSILSKSPEFRCAFFARLGIWRGEAHTFELLLADDKPRPGFTFRNMNLLLNTVELLRREAELVLPILIDPSLNGALHVDEGEILGRITHSPHAELIIDSDAQVLHANTKMEELLGKSAGQDLGTAIGNYAPSFTAAFPVLCKQAMKSLVGSPLLEFQNGENTTQSYCLVVQPLVGNETGKRFAKVSASDVARFNHRLLIAETSVADAAGNKPQDPPTLEFLMDTLGKHPTIRMRHGIPYLTLRTWRRPLKEFQIKAIQYLKQHDLKAFSKLIAEDIASNFGSLVGAGAFRCIVPMPCGHSRRTDCLSVMMARQLSIKLGIEMIEAFEHQTLPGKSHPKANTSRPPLVLKKVVKEPTILIDDVATSGSHIEEAMNLLRQHCSAVMPIVWISGSTKE